MFPRLNRRFVMLFSSSGPPASLSSIPGRNTTRTAAAPPPPPIMTIRQSLENLTGRPSTNSWNHDPNSVEMQSAPRLSVNDWCTSADAIRPAPAAENPFQDPSIHHEQDPIHPSAAHTHQDRQNTHPVFRNDVEGQHHIPKAPGTPSITALPLHLPYMAPREEHPQKFHRVFLTCRLLVQTILFVLALVGFFLAYPKTITYTGMLTGNSLGFVLTWAALLVLVYFLDKGMRMSRYSTQPEQWKKCLKMIVFDCMIVWVWLLVCWGNTAFAKGVMEEAAKKAAPTPGKNAGQGATKFTPPVLIPKPTGH